MRTDKIQMNSEIPCTYTQLSKTNTVDKCLYLVHIWIKTRSVLVSFLPRFEDYGYFVRCILYVI